MIRVLQCVNNMHRAGLETMLMNYYRNIDRTKIQFDFLTHRPERDDYDDEIESMGGRIFRAPRLYPQNYPAYFSYMRQFFREHPEYQIMHSHIDTMSYLPLLAGKKAGIPVRIAHSHSTSIDRDFKYLLKQYFRNRLLDVANYHLACGIEAGQFLFKGSSFKVIPNAINMGAFYFDEEVRSQKREELQLEDCFVVGHVGRLSYPKNHEFLLHIFKEILEQNHSAVLLLVGSGEKQEQLQELAEKLGILHRVRFMGNRGDVNKLYQAMDVFVMPSLFEGVPLVGVEAQTANLPCFFSDKVPLEVRITDNCEFRSLTEKPEQWAEAILHMEMRDRLQIPQKLLGSQFDIQNACGTLESYYLELAEKHCCGSNISCNDI